MCRQKLQLCFTSSAIRPFAFTFRFCFSYWRVSDFFPRINVFTILSYCSGSKISFPLTREDFYAYSFYFFLDHQGKRNRCRISFFKSSCHHACIVQNQLNRQQNPQARHTQEKCSCFENRGMSISQKSQSGQISPTLIKTAYALMTPETDNRQWNGKEGRTTLHSGTEKWSR